MKKVLIILVILLVGVTSLSVPTKAEAAPAIFPSFKLPNALRVRIDSEQKNHFLNLYFSNLFFVNKISYEFAYNHDDGQEGIVGEIMPRGKVVVKKEIILGTCSADTTCVYHKNIQNMRLKVTTNYKFFDTSETKFYSL